MKNLTILLLLLIPSVGGSSSALYIANLVDSGRITVDGDLSEWTNLGDAEPIARVLDEVATLEPQDLSARFRCVVDELNLYVAVEVTDDQLVYGTEAFRSGESDDCLAIFFDGDLVDVEKDHFDSNDGQITVVREKDGSVRLAGSAGVFWLNPRQSHQDIVFPYMWDLLGVEAAAEGTENGYSIEVRIPVAVLGLERFSGATEMGLDFLVADDDDGGFHDRHINWAPTPRGVSPHRRTEFYGRLRVVDEAVVGGDLSSEVLSTARVLAADELELVLGADVQAAPSFLHARFADDNRASLRAHLDELESNQQDRMAATFASAVLARLDWRTGKHEEALSRYERLASFDSTPSAIELYCLTKIAELSEQAGDLGASVEALTRFGDLSDPLSASPGPMLLAQHYQRRNLHGEAGRCYSDVLALEPVDTGVYRTASFGLGRCHMIRGNLKEATKQFEAWQERSEVQSGQSWTYAEYNLGMIAMFEGDHAMALKKFESILQEPKAKIAIAKIHLNAKIAIAKIHLRLGNYDKTRELMERIAEEHPDYSIAPLFEFP